MQGGRKLSSWNIFVKKIYQEGHSNDKNYSFKQALTDASRRKGEMGSSTGMGTKKTMGKKGKKMNKKVMSATRSMSMTGGRTRRRRRH
jgi:hypothetical protein